MTLMIFVILKPRSFMPHTPLFLDVAPLFPSPVKKMLFEFAKLFDFLLVTRFFIKRLQKVVPFSRTRAAVKFRTKNNGVCTPESGGNVA